MYEPSCLERLLTKLVFYSPLNRIYREFAQSLPLQGHESVLDYGSGMGTVAYYTIPRLPQGHLTCMDISKKWLHDAKRLLKTTSSITFVHGEVQQLAITPESFDVIYCHFVLHDIPVQELESVVQCLLRCLKKGGYLVIKEPLADSFAIQAIQSFIEANNMMKCEKYITDVPLMGTSLVGSYRKHM